MHKIFIIAIGLLVLYAPIFAQENTDKPERKPSEEGQKIQDQHEEYLREKEKMDTIPAFKYYNFYDTLLSNISFYHENLKDRIARSIYHDPGDYLKFNKSNLVVHYRFVPIRTTATPYNLPGNRTNTIFNNKKIDPIDHQVQPDNKIDFNDIPTETVQDVYNVDGPLGMLFGGDNATSSLILVPQRPETTQAESQMIADVGWYGYSYTKAMFAHRNLKGRSLKIGIGRRKVNNDTPYDSDEADHQWAELIMPVREKIRLALELRMYKREGYVPVRLDNIPDYIERFHKDKDLSTAVEFGHNSLSRTIFKYNMTSSAHNYLGVATDYNHNIDIAAHNGSVTNEGLLGSIDYQINLSGSQERYQEFEIDNKRHRGYGDIKLIKADGSISMFAYSKLEKVGDFDPGPSGMFQISFHKPIFRARLSAGYATKFPRQYELDLKATYNNFYSGTTGNDYLELGNSALKAEKQIVGNIGIGLGSPGNDLMLSLTGGNIFDGIDWRQFDTLDLSFGAFQPINQDLDFATASMSQNLSWSNKMLWTGGASYHYLDIENDPEPAYAPDYQLFSSLQLYYYWEKLDLHLYAYGEGFYNGKYIGYDGSPLGQEFVSNFKLSFRIKKFRFYYVTQNLFDYSYIERESFSIPGRFDFYGVTWDFID